MKHQRRGMTLLTKWMLEVDEDMDPWAVRAYGDATVDAYVEIEGLGRNDIPVGGWIAESPLGRRKEYGLLDPGAPSIERIARTFQLQKVEPLILF